MDQDQQRDYSEEQYLRHFCPECGESPCVEERARPGRAVDGWLESLRAIRAVLDSAANQGEATR